MSSINFLTIDGKDSLESRSSKDTVQKQLCNSPWLSGSEMTTSLTEKYSKSNRKILSSRTIRKINSLQNSHILIATKPNRVELKSSSTQCDLLLIKSLSGKTISSFNGAFSTHISSSSDEVSTATNDLYCEDDDCGDSTPGSIANENIGHVKENYDGDFCDKDNKGDIDVNSISIKMKARCLLRLDSVESTNTLILAPLSSKSSTKKTTPFGSSFRSTKTKQQLSSLALDEMQADIS